MYVYSTSYGSLAELLPVPYPFLGDLTPVQRALFYSIASLINIGLFHLANAVHFGVDKVLGRNVAIAKAQAQGKRA